MSKKQSNKKESPREVVKKQSTKNLPAAPPETEGERLARQHQIIENLNQQNIHNYLKNLDHSSHTNLLVTKVNISTIQKMISNLQTGLMTLPDKSTQMNKLISIQQKISKEELKQKQLKVKRDEIQRKIQYLSEQIRGDKSVNKLEKEGNLEVEVKDVLSKDQHLKKIKQILAEKAQRRKRHKQLLEQIQKKEKDEELKKQSMKKLQESNQKQKKRSQIGLKIRKRHQDHQRFLSQELKLRKQYQLIKKKKVLHQQMESKFTSQVLLPILEEKKNKLKQIRDFHKRYGIETIKQHEKDYKIRRQNILANSKTQKEKIISKNDYKPPARTQRLSKFLEQQQILHKEKLQEKRRDIQDKIKRKQNFVIELKEKYQPKIDNQKRKQIEARILQEHRKRQKPQVDLKKLGHKYLEVAKSLHRSKSIRSQALNSEKSEQKQQKEKRSETYHLPHNRSQQFYQNVRRKKLEDIINSQESPQNKYMRLQIETDKISEKFKQKEELMRYNHNQQFQNEAAQLLLSSIKAKMGIINLLKRPPHSQL